jgi:hypothetical protein
VCVVVYVIDHIVCAQAGFFERLAASPTAAAKVRGDERMSHVDHTWCAQAKAHAKKDGDATAAVDSTDAHAPPSAEKRVASKALIDRLAGTSTQARKVRVGWVCRVRVRACRRIVQSHAQSKARDVAKAGSAPSSPAKPAEVR